MSRLPTSWSNPEVQRNLSADGQLYLKCAKCDSESRVPIISVGSKNAEYLKEQCGQCGAKQKWKIVTHQMVATVQCQDCGESTDTVLGLDSEMRCGHCESARVSSINAEVNPPFLPTFLDLPNALSALISLGSKKNQTHIWGRSGKEDAIRINAEAQSLTILPEQHRYLFPLICFALRLEQSHSDESANGRYWLANIIGNLAQGYTRKARAPDMGALAVSCFAKMVELAEDSLTRAIAQHSYAMGVFTLLTSCDEDALGKWLGDMELRLHAVEAVKEAAATLEEAQRDEVQGAENQLALVHWIIGDLLRSGNADDTQRRMALDYFRKTLSHEPTTLRVGVSVIQSLAQTVQALSDPSKEELREAVGLLVETVSESQSDGQFENAWRGYFILSLLQRKLGDWKAAHEAARIAASHSLQQFSALTDESLLLVQAETFVPVLEDLACTLAASGLKDDSINAVEITRAASIRIYTMGQDARKAQLKEIQMRQREDIYPAILKKEKGLPSLVDRLSQCDIIDYLWDNPINDAAEAVLGAFATGPAAYLSLFISDNIATGAVWARDGKGKHTLDTLQWKPVQEELSWLRAQRYVAPGPFRERLVGKACALSFKNFLEPLLPILSAVKPEHLLISLPGIFSRMPLEQGFSLAGASLPGSPPAVSYLPSLRLGADICSIAGKHSIAAAKRRVLLVGYDAKDMPRLADEMRELKSIWGKHLTVIEGAACTKQDVMEALCQPYDIIHFMCHGTYQSSSPLESALHFIPQVENDARRLTANDLLKVGRLPHRPVVVLSACSSGLTADARTNSFHGLPGSLFRIGARAIIGSRWPVHDDAASRLMVRLHEEMNRSDDSLDSILARVVKSFEQTMPVEDAAAFAMFGIG